MKGPVTGHSLKQGCTHGILASICMNLNLFSLVRLEDLKDRGCCHCSPQLLKGFLALRIPLEHYVLLSELR